MDLPVPTVSSWHTLVQTDIHTHTESRREHYNNFIITLVRIMKAYKVTKLHKTEGNPFSTYGTHMYVAELEAIEVWPQRLWKSYMYVSVSHYQVWLCMCVCMCACAKVCLWETEVIWLKHSVCSLSGLSLSVPQHTNTWLYVHWYVGIMCTMYHVPCACTYMYMMTSLPWSPHWYMKLYTYSIMDKLACRAQS